MLKSFKSILFATNLKENCRPAFDFAVSLATKYQAKIVLLHVLESKIPDYVESRVRGLVGEDRWQNIRDTQESSARQALIAKKSTNQLVRTALDQFCSDAGIDDDACRYPSREIVVTDGDLIDEIITQSEKYNCDMIIMGAREGLIRKTAISHIIKGVLHRSEIPVIVVPAEASPKKA